LALELGLVDRHQGLERPDQPAGLGEGLALDGSTHHRGRRLADRTALTPDLHVVDPAVVDLEIEHDLVPAERVEALGLVRRRDRELATVARRAVVVEDDLSVEVFQAGHGTGSSGLEPEAQRAKNFSARATASTSMSASCSSL